MHTCEGCSGCSKRSTHPKSPASEREGRGHSGALTFSNRGRGKVCEGGRSRYDKVLSMLILQTASPLSEHLQSGKSCSFSLLGSSSSMQDSQYSLVFFRVQLNLSFSVSTATTTVHLDVPHLTHSTYPKALNTFIFSEPVPSLACRATPCHFISCQSSLLSPFPASHFPHLVSG